MLSGGMVSVSVFKKIFINFLDVQNLFVTAPNIVTNAELSQLQAVDKNNSGA